MGNYVKFFSTAAALFGSLLAGAGVQEAPEKYWDFAKLSNPPKYKEVNYPDSAAPGFKSIIIEGVPYQQRPSGVNAVEWKTLKGTPSQMFAYIGFPSTPMPKGGYPGIVLVHGGGGTAFANYAKQWVDRGYAVIVPDWYSCRPLVKPIKAKKIVKGKEKISVTNKVPLDGIKTFRYQLPETAANLVLAHSLLRSLPNVNPDRTIYIGLSWGSWYGSMVAAIDPRFKGCIEIYCGDRNPRTDWRALTDGRFLHAAKIPMFWVTSTHDQNVTMQSLQRGFDECANIVNKNYVVKLPHSHIGFTFDSCARMAAYFLKGEKMLPKLGKITVKDGIASTDILYHGKGITKTVFCYTTDRKIAKQHLRKWHTIPAEMKGNRLSVKLPADLYIGFFSAYDQKSRFNDCCGSSDIIVK